MTRGKLIDLTGQQFGDYVVVERDLYSDKAKKNTNVTRYWCQCSCGTIKSINASTLRNGGTHGCSKCMGLKQRTNIAGEIPSVMWATLLLNAESRGHRVFVSPEYAWDKFLEQDGRCALSGLQIGFRDGMTDNGKRTLNTASFDRIDSGGEYEEGNVQWVHKQVNMMKGQLNEIDFFAYCVAVAKNVKTVGDKPRELHDPGLRNCTL